MSLRQAKFDDHWRHTFTRTYPTRLSQVTTQGLRGFADGTITFSGGINAIVGLNGVGKSTLGAAIADLLQSDPNPAEQGYAARLQGSSLTGIAHFGGKELHLRVEPDAAGNRQNVGEGFHAEACWLDPSFLGARILYQVQQDHNFNDLLDPLTPLELDEDDLKVASYLVGKKYDRIAIYEISDYSDLTRFPYFRVAAEGVEYTTEGMGRGELSVLLTYWTLKDLAKNSILILEEPETHVSPRSQDCLMNVIAKFCDEMGLWVIAITHSPTVIRRIPIDYIRALTRVGATVRCAAAPKKLDIALMLGGGVSYSGVVLVEDAAARDFALGIFEGVDRELLRQFEILVAGSESNISGALRMMPTTERWLTLVGAYDGDMRGSIDASGFKWPHSFLPGNIAPEEILIAFIAEPPTIADALAVALERTVEDVQMALNSGGGVDHHDYFRVVATALNIDIAILRRAVIRTWLSDAGNHDGAERFVNQIRQASQWKPAQ